MLLMLALGAATAVPAAPSARALSLHERVLRAGEFKGYKPAQTTLFKSPRTWLSSDTGLTRTQIAARTARLRRAGFAALLIERLISTRARDRAGLSWVLQLSSARAARAELTAAVKDSVAFGRRSRHRYAAFRVTGIPGARAFRLTTPGSVGDNVMFADGRFLYLVGAHWDPFTTRVPARAPLIAAAKTLYRRVHGRPLG